MQYDLHFGKKREFQIDQCEHFWCKIVFQTKNPETIRPAWCLTYSVSLEGKKCLLEHQQKSHFQHHETKQFLYLKNSKTYRKRNLRIWREITCNYK